MNILITRPSPDGEILVNKLLAAGRLAYHLPLIYFLPGRELFLLCKQLNSLSKGDFLFILSRNVVRYAHNQLLNLGMVWPRTLIYYSIGKATSLQMYNISGILTQYPENNETSENLLELFNLHFNHVNGRRALILRGNNGRAFLINTLQSRGMCVFCCECYQSQPIQYNEKEREEECYRMLFLKIKIIVVTSGIILKQLFYLVPDYYRVSWLVKCRLVVVSPRLVKLAMQLGWKDVVISQSANNDVLMDFLINNSK